MTKTTLIVPCFNEADRFWPDEFQNLIGMSDAHLLFVNDGSTDDTANILQATVAEIGCKAELMTLANNGGKGEAVRLGLCQAIDQGADMIGFIDADMATSTRDVCRLLDAVRDGRADVILGSRVALLGYDIRRSPVRHYLGRVFATAAALTLGLPIYDTQCGAKFFRVTDSVKAALAEPFHSRWAFDVELIGRILVLTGPERMMEMPLQSWHSRPGSTLSFPVMVRSFLELISIYRHLTEYQRR